MTNYSNIDPRKTWITGKVYLIICLLLISVQYTFAEDTKRVIAFGNMAITDNNYPLILHHLEYATRISEEPFVLLFVGGFLDGDSCNIRLVKRLHEYTDKIHLIPGSKEWETLGPTGLLDLDDQLKDDFETDVFIPDNACGEVESKSISDDIELLAIDSKWFLQDWENQDELNKDCEIQSRDQFLFELTDEVMSNKEKSLILTMYHPPFRSDAKSGDHKLIHNLFPFTTRNRHLYFPLPIIGTYFLQAQSFLRPHEYKPHPRYRELSDHVENLAEDHQKLLVISGDGLISDIVERENCKFINVNSDPNIHSYIVNAPNQFTQEASVLYIRASLDAYQYEFKSLTNPEISLVAGHQKLPEIVRDEIVPDSLHHALPSTFRTTISTEEKFPHLGADWLTGTLYTDLYRTPIEVPTLDLSAGEDLTPIKIGGGQQTISVRLKNERDQEYVIRSLQKRPTKLLSRKLRISFIEDFIEYYFTSAHPFAAVSVPVIEESLGLYHTNPGLYYIPTQKQLAPYNDEIGNQLVLFRERADDNWESSISLGRSKNIISTSDMREDLLENKLRVDATYYLKNRLMDLTLGDWDRHSDQWRWARGSENEGAHVDTYFPVGRDRDQAMSNFDGLLMKILRFYDPSFKPMRPFDDKITRSEVRWQGYSASSLDDILLSGLDKDQWQDIADEMQADLSRDIIEDAINRMPQEISNEKKQLWTNTLWRRFESLDQTTDHFYDEFHKDPVFYASNLKDSIFIHFHKKDTGRITIKSQNEDEEWIMKVDRNIIYDDVGVLRIHALEGDDVIVLNKSWTKPKIIILGGYGNDQYVNHGKRSPKNIKIIEQEENEQEDAFPQLRISTTDQKSVDQIPRRAALPSYSTINPSFEVNDDDGVFLGLSGKYHINRFKKEIIHSAKVTFATERQSSQIQYGLQVNNALRKATSFLEINLDGPRYESNFYGMGNESTYDPSLNESYYYLRRQLQTIHTGLQWSLGPIGQLSTGLYGERIMLQQVEGRYINEFITDKSKRGPNHFLGFYVDIDYSNFNSNLKTTDGVKLGINITGKKGLDNQKNHIILNPYYHLYKSIGRQKRLIYSTKIQYQGILGDYFFFQAPAMGGSDYLRGYRRERFRGKAIIAHNNNLHLKLVDRVSSEFFPAGLGITASFDYGRAWLQDEKSTKWHSNWGAGIWISPLNAFIISGSVFKSPETTELRIKLGWQF